jgi:predicted amidohydrolase YtcJ
MTPRLVLCIGLGSVTALGGSAVAQHTRSTDLVFVNGNIYTMDGRQPRAEALAIRNGRIIAVGSNDDVRRRVSDDARVRDLKRRTVLPGLIDAHAHVASLGSFGLGCIDLSSARSFDQVVQMVANKAAKTPAGQWILGGRWDHETWPDKRLPTHEQLSAVTPDNPVWLTRVDGHVGLANAAAMARAGITPDTRAPAGGEILRDADGNPTGLFVDNAEDLITRHIDDAVADAEALILKAQEMCLSAGLTGVHDMGVSPAEIDAYKRLADSGRLKLRVYLLVSAPYAMEYFTKERPYVSERVTVRGCKLYVDGAMGSQGAWLLEPYSDRPTDADGRPYTGLNVTPPEDIRKIARHALQHGYQVCTHAIGDRGNRVVLDAYAAALEQAPHADHRFRIEHAQLLAPDDVPRFAQLGVIPSMQPTHCTTDMRWVYARVGRERARGAYAWASLLKTGARIAAGSDFPVESHNPFPGLYAAITRQNAAGEPPGGWHPEQRMTRTEALRAFTLDAAHAAFEEDRKGSLSPGKLADFVIIDRDVMTCEPKRILETRALKTIIGGETVYEASRSE